MKHRGNISSQSGIADEVLLQRIYSGGADSSQAFSELYARYSHSIYLYCRKLARQEDEANDVYQEAWIRFYKQAQTSTSITKVQPYLIRIARNVFLNLRRDEPPWASELEDDLTHYTPDYGQEELFGLISTAIEFLEFSYREAFILRFYEGFSYKEMANITGDSVSALKVRVMRAKEQIREIVAPYIEDLNI